MRITEIKNDELRNKTMGKEEENITIFFRLLISSRRIFRIRRYDIIPVSHPSLRWEMLKVFGETCYCLIKDRK